MNSRPNVLVILADDLAANVLRTADNTQAPTPNLDRLASESARLQSLFCTSPLCTPARGSLLTGLLPWRSGVLRLQDVLADGTQTLARQFHASDYRTATFGKMHFGQDCKPGLHGFEICRSDLNWYGPKHHPPSPEPDTPTQPPWQPLIDPARIWLNADRLPFPAYDEQKPNRRVANEVNAFLEEDHQYPFFCWVGFNQPHSPFNIPLDARFKSDPASFDLPEVDQEDQAQIPTIYRGLSDDDKRGIIAAYHDAVAYLDELVGSVLDSLERAGLRDDTIVFFSADHGYLLGQHGRFEKHCHYDEALRVPGMIRWPGQIPERDFEGLMSGVDFAPTLLSLCELEKLPRCDGMDLSAQLRGDRDDRDDRDEWPRKEIVSTYSANRVACLRNEHHKLILRGGDPAKEDPFNYAGCSEPEQSVRLFDLKKDPHELHDLSTDQVDRCEQMQKRLMQVLDEGAPGIL